MPDPNAYYAGGLGVEMYDLFTGGGLLEGDIAFYLACAERFGGPVLELGTGTGRLLIPLLEAGHEVTGLDLSSAMLERARARLRDLPELAGRARLVHGDMSAFDLDQRFPLVIIPARSFQHLADPTLQKAALDCVRRHLQPGGHLVLDLFDPNFELLAAPPGEMGPPSREARHPTSGNRVRRTVVDRYHDEPAQVIHEALLFEEIDGSGELIASEEHSWALRWSTREETAGVLDLCGFQPIELYSDFLGSGPAYGREQLWIARAKETAKDSD